MSTLFLTLYAYCELIFSDAWSQAFAILRIALEQASTVYVLVEIPESLKEYLKLYDLYLEYIRLESKDDKMVFFKKT